MTRLSDIEIIDQWEAARDKKRKLDQLAAACRMDRDGMRQKLKELGCFDIPQKLVPYKGASAGWKGQPRRKIDGERVRELFAEGKTDAEIAAALGFSECSIRNWRNRNRLFLSTQKQTEKAGGWLQSYIEAIWCLGEIAGVAEEYEDDDSAALRRAARRLRDLLEGAYFGAADRD